MKLIPIKLLQLILMLSLASCQFNQPEEQTTPPEPLPCQSTSETSLTVSSENGVFEARKTKSSIQIDGCDKDEIWSELTWYDMNHIWMGTDVDSSDYHGRFKLAWDSLHLIILVEVIDDYLNPTLANGKENYWKGDYVEVFIDEDQSGGGHHFNHQAFAYHVSTEGHAIDKSTLEETVFFDDHVEVQRSQEGNKYLWEMAIKLFDKDFDENSTTNKPVTIYENKRIGFSIAYGDNDGKDSRENFMGSKKTHGINNDEGYTNSDVFGQITFIK